ncbi:MAG: transposase [Burkholderiaceae bacterium]
MSQRAQILRQQEIAAERDRALDGLARTERELARKVQELVVANALAEKLKFEIARYQRWRFGKKSEALGAEQIALWEAELDADIEALQCRLANLDTAPMRTTSLAPRASRAASHRRRPCHGIEERLEPDSTVCGCGNRWCASTAPRPCR